MTSRSRSERCAAERGAARIAVAGIDAYADWRANRSLLLLQEHSSVSTPLLVVVVAWFCADLSRVRLFAPRNGTVVATLFLCALAVSGACSSSSRWMGHVRG